MLRRPVIFMTGLYHGGARYELRFLPLADFSGATPASRDALIRAAIERYVEILESLCREAPYNWFNFFDFWALDAAAPAGSEAHADHEPIPRRAVDPGPSAAKP
jgi:predicted LPLAT superfamily acyltransferase